MKVKNIKLKPVKTCTKDENDESYHSINSCFSKYRSPFEPVPSDAGQGQQMLDVFKEILNTLKMSKIQSTPPVRSDVEPRDKEVLLDPNGFFENGTISEKNLKKWAAEVFTKVFSTTFNYFSKN